MSSPAPGRERRSGPGGQRSEDNVSCAWDLAGSKHRAPPKELKRWRIPWLERWSWQASASFLATLSCVTLPSWMGLRPFHHAFVVRDLAETRRFYVDVMGCSEGRSAPSWIDFERFGNQLSCHLGTPPAPQWIGEVDGIVVPLPHFGVIVSLEEYELLAERLTRAEADFIVTPRVRYPGEA